MVLEPAASQVPAALAATGTSFFSGTYGCVCFVGFGGGGEYGNASLRAWLKVLTESDRAVLRKSAQRGAERSCVEDVQKRFCVLRDGNTVVGT